MDADKPPVKEPNRNKAPPLSRPIALPPKLSPVFQPRDTVLRYTHRVPQIPANTLGCSLRIPAHESFPFLDTPKIKTKSTNLISAPKYEQEVVKPSVSAPVSREASISSGDYESSKKKRSNPSMLSRSLQRPLSDWRVTSVAPPRLKPLKRVYSVGSCNLAGLGAGSSIGVGFTETSNSGVGLTETANSGVGLTESINSGIGLTGTANSGVGLTETANSGGLTETANSGVGLTGTANSGVGLTGTANSGVGLTGTANSGVGLTGTANSGAGLTGTANSGVGLTGTANSGLGLTETANSGVGLTGTANSDVGLTGTANSGEGLTGSINSGIGLTETTNSGVYLTETASLGEGLTELDSPDAVEMGFVNLGASFTGSKIHFYKDIDEIQYKTSTADPKQGPLDWTLKSKVHFDNELDVIHCKTSPDYPKQGPLDLDSTLKSNKQVSSSRDGYHYHSSAIDEDPDYQEIDHEYYMTLGLGRKRTKKYLSMAVELQNKSSVFSEKNKKVSGIRKPEYYDISVRNRTDQKTRIDELVDLHNKYSVVTEKNKKELGIRKPGYCDISVRNSTNQKLRIDERTHQSGSGNTACGGDAGESKMSPSFHGGGSETF